MIYLIGHFLQFSDVVLYIFWIHPICALVSSLFKIGDSINLKSKIKSISAPRIQVNEIIFRNHIFQAHLFIWNMKSAILPNIMIMILVGVFIYILIIIIECGAFRLIKQSIVQSTHRTYPISEIYDEDVLAENERINRMNPLRLKAETIAIQNASKFYNNFCAVNKFSAIIEKYTFEIDLQMIPSV